MDEDVLISNRILEELGKSKAYEVRDGPGPKKRRTSSRP